MVEKEQVREKEAEIVGGKHYEQKMKHYSDIIERGRTGKKVVHGKDIPWRLSRQAITKHYCDYDLLDNCLTYFNFFVHEIRTHSGKHVHQGGIVIFVLKGQGKTVVDGVDYNWSEGDLILLPIKKGGVEHQHFNKDDKPSRWLAMLNNPLADLLGNFLQQKENHPNWKG